MNASATKSSCSTTFIDPGAPASPPLATSTLTLGTCCGDTAPVPLVPENRRSPETTQTRTIIKTTSDRLPSRLSRLGFLNSAIELSSRSQTHGAASAYHGRVSIMDVLLGIGCRVPDLRHKRPRVCLGSDTGPPRLLSYTGTAGHGDRANAKEL